MSHSGLQTFGSCPRKYRYIYEDKRVVIRQTDALAFGSVVHEGLAQLLTTGVVDLREFAAQVRPEDAYRISAMLELFPDTWRQYRVLGVEVPFDVAIYNPRTGHPLRGARMRGYIDGILERDGRTYVLEHKTTSEEIVGFGQYWQRLAIDDQIATYKRVLKADSIIYSVLRKPGIRPAAIDRKTAGGESATEAEVLRAYGERCRAVIAAAPEEYYQWREIHRTPEEDAEAAQSLYDRTKILLQARKNGAYPKYSHACRTIYGPCPYLEVCTGRARLDDDALFCDREERR